MRQTIKDLGGTVPEDLPVAESIKNVKSQHQKRLREKQGGEEK